jgi:hypothetical protein
MFSFGSQNDNLIFFFKKERMRAEKLQLAKESEMRKKKYFTD